MPSCSLVIPVYNHAEYLSQCIDSAVNQLNPFDEIVIVDDCSPDPRVSDILEKYQGISSIKIFKNSENLGITGTQNYALSLCSSEFVAFLDCDDYLHREARAGFDAYYKVKVGDYYFSNRIEFNQSGMSRKVDVSSQIYEYNSLTECLLEHMVASHFKVIRRETLLSIGGFPANSDGVQDWVVAVNIINDDNAVHIGEYIYYHRIHANQTTGQDSVRYVNVVNGERERLLELRGLKRSFRREAVTKLAWFFSRVENFPRGAFVLDEGVMEPWVASTFAARGSCPSALLIYSPHHHKFIAQDFYLCRSLGMENVMLVDRRSPDSIATTRWASAFMDHIVCLDPIARLAIEPWVADRSKLIDSGVGDIIVPSSAPRVATPEI
ncbi:glycosyltransferase [Rhizobium alvei]|uniref:Glycosyltransferase n=1 Tax=Rhizobium alvei TaxID=1132659 RepID=A0ABT8YQB2_9HYPH|nr:glycosyltransferase [Rhizobium alvei]MDO6965499.1 glycosyltransferase [Rhizobium alvei]